MKVLSLFAGMGGFDLGLSLAGMEIVAQVEISKYCSKILEGHFPNAKRWGDIRTVTGAEVERAAGPIDVVCGGFPCQDISGAGKGAGLDASRSGLWWEMHRLIADLKPNWVIIENVDALRARGIERVIAAMAEVGYQTEVLGVSAAAVGASQQRKRLWILGYSAGKRLNSWRPEPKRLKRKPSINMSGNDVADTNSKCGTAGSMEAGDQMVETTASSAESGSNSELAYTKFTRWREGWGVEGDKGSAGERRNQSDSGCQTVADTNSDTIREQSGRELGPNWAYSPFSFPACPGEQQYEWEESRTIESTLGITADGLPVRLALHAIGNAVVPAIPYAIARAIQRVQRVIENS